MGEIADAMLEGVFCQVCGEYMGEGDGFPVTCAGCQEDDFDDDEDMDNPEAKHYEETHPGNWDKRAQNRIWSTAHLRELGIGFESKNDGAHLIVRHGNYCADFWPGTGYFKFRKKSEKGGKSGRGVNSLLKELGVNA